MLAEVIKIAVPTRLDWLDWTWLAVSLDVAVSLAVDALRLSDACNVAIKAATTTIIQPTSKRRQSRVLRKRIRRDSSYVSSSMCLSVSLSITLAVSLSLCHLTVSQSRGYWACPVWL